MALIRFFFLLNKKIINFVDTALLIYHPNF
jgi:hypothetical protein